MGKDAEWMNAVTDAGLLKTKKLRENDRRNGQDRELVRRPGLLCKEIPGLFEKLVK